MQIAHLFVYPVKGMTGVSMGACHLFLHGLEHDRQWVVCDANGDPLKAAKHPKIRLVQVRWEDDSFVFRAPAMPAIRDWDDVDAWLSDYFGIQCALMNVERKLDKDHGGRVSFSHGFPLLLQSQASLDDLNRRLEKPVTLLHFRPNIVVEGCGPYEEDTWSLVRIGDLLLDVKDPCPRCLSTTIDPDNARVDQQQEPFKTLSSYRTDSQGNVNLGMYLVPRAEGQLRVGDTVELLERKTAATP